MRVTPLRVVWALAVVAMITLLWYRTRVTVAFGGAGSDRQRLGAGEPAPRAAAAGVGPPGVGAGSTPRDCRPATALVHLPEEIWLLMCGFLRSADFAPR